MMNLKNSSLIASMNNLKTVEISLSNLRFACPNIIWDVSYLSSLFSWDSNKESRYKIIADAYKVKEFMRDNRSHRRNFKPDPYEIYKEICSKPLLKKSDFNSVFDATSIIIDFKYSAISKDAEKIIELIRNSYKDADKGFILAAKLLLDNPLWAPENLAYTVAKGADIPLAKDLFEAIKKVLIPKKTVIESEKIRKIILDVLCFLDYKKDCNDIDLETKILYQHTAYQAYNGKNKNILIIKPCLFFIKRWLNDFEINKKKHTTFVIDDVNTVSLLNTIIKQNSIEKYIEIIAFNDFMGRSMPLNNLSLLLIIGNKIDSNSTKSDIINNIVEYDSNIEKILLFDGDANLSNDKSQFCKYIKNNLITHYVFTFPSQIINATKPSNKMLFLCNTSQSKSKEIRVFSFMKIESVEGSQALSLHLHEAIIPYENYINNTKSIRSEFFDSRRNELKKDKSAIISPATFIDFTDEIQIKYTFSNNIKDGKCNLYATMYYVNSDKEMTELVVKHKYKTDKENLENWLLNVFPYEHKSVKTGEDKTSVRSIVTDKMKDKFEIISPSTKTFYYLHQSIDSKYSEEEIAKNRELLNTNLGSIYIDNLNIDVVDNILDDYFINQDLSNQSLALDFINDLITIAKNEGYKIDKNLVEIVNSNKNKYSDFSKISNNLSKKSLSITEIKSIYRIAKRHYDSGKREYLGVIISLILGLDYYTVCALEWNNFVHNTTYKDHDFHQIYILSKRKFDGKKCKTTEILEEYRLIPCPSMLTEILLNEYNNVLSESKSEHDAKIKSIVFGNDKDDKGTSYLSPKALANLSKNVMKEAGIESDLISFSTKDLSTNQRKLSSFINIFKNNYRHHMLHKANCSEGELAYLLGNKAPDTFSNNYCDYENTASQLTLFLMQERYINLIFRDNYPISESRNLDTSKEYNMPKNKSNLITSTLDIELNKDKNASLEIDSDFGFDVSVTPHKKG